MSNPLGAIAVSFKEYMQCIPYITETVSCQEGVPNNLPIGVYLVTEGGHGIKFHDCISSNGEEIEVYSPKEYTRIVVSKKNLPKEDAEIEIPGGRKNAHDMIYIKGRFVVTSACYCIRAEF